MKPSEMKALLKNILELQQKESKLSGSRRKSTLPKTAGIAKIKAFEKKHGLELPPSYKTFLSIHDGWYQPAPRDSFAGVSGGWFEKLQKDSFKRFCYRFWMKDIVRRFPNNRERRAHLKSLGAPFAPGRDYSVARKDLKARAAAEKFLAKKLVIGGDLEGDYYFFDMSKKKPSGEMPLTSYSLMMKKPVRGSFKDFAEYLRRVEAALQSTIKSLEAHHKKSR